MTEDRWEASVLSFIGGLASTKSNFFLYWTVLNATRLKFLTAFLLQISLTFIQTSRDYTSGPLWTPTHLLYLFCNSPHTSCGRMAALRGQTLPSAELAMAFVNCEKQRGALIVGMAGMSAGYAKPPVNPIKCRELAVVWREQAILLQDLSIQETEVLDNESCGGQPDADVSCSPAFTSRNLELASPRAQKVGNRAYMDYEEERKPFFLSLKHT